MRGCLNCNNDRIPKLISYTQLFNRLTYVYKSKPVLAEIPTKDENPNLRSLVPMFIPTEMIRLSLITLPLTVWEEFWLRIPHPPMANFQIQKLS